MNTGDELNHIVVTSRNALFDQSRLVQLTYGAFELAAQSLDKNESSELQLSYPVAWGADGQPVLTTDVFSKSELMAQYGYLAVNQLAINGLAQLVAITEAMLSDLIRTVVVKYPHKLGPKRTIPLGFALEAASIEELHIRATDSLINELTYKSPQEFAKSFEKLVSFNLLECPAFHKYVETKATRDIHVHNRGVANDTYVRKAGSHQRVQAGQSLPVDLRYFWESYESCLQFGEWLERQLHDKWHSSALEARQNEHSQLSLDLPSPPPLQPATHNPPLQADEGP